MASDGLSLTRAGKLFNAAERILTAEGPMDRWARQCHAASIALVKSGEFGECRVARGTCNGVGGQHSWVVLSMDVYDKRATIIDPTLWSQSEEWEERLGGQHVWVGLPNYSWHRPKGSGQIWDYGRPSSAVEMGQEPMTLTPRKPWSPWAESFLHMMGPLSEAGWISLAHFPMEGWPSGEIIDAMIESGLEGYIPIDIRGMVTDRNPNGLYLP